MGDFTGFDDYFESAYDPGYGEPFTAEQYESLGLDREISQGWFDPISRHVRFWKLHYSLLGCRSLATMHAFASEQTGPEIAAALSGWNESLSRIENEIDDMLAAECDGQQPNQTSAQNQEAIDALRSEMKAQFSKGQKSNFESKAYVCVLNPANFSRSSTLKSGVVVDLPAMGWMAMSPERETQIKTLDRRPACR